MVRTNCPIVSTNWLNKVIVAMMTMAITFAMPVMAGNKTMVSTNRQHNNGKNDKVVVVINNDKKVSHFDKYDKRTSHFDTHTNVYRPDVKSCTFKVSRHDEQKRAAIAGMTPKTMQGIMAPIM